MDKKFVIYKYTSPSGGVYIGQTCQKLKYRSCSEGQGYLHREKETGEYFQPALANAIIKYGWDNFEKEILFTNLTSEEADKKETELISYYRKGGKCYNIANGGKGIPGTRERRIKQFSLSGEFIKEWDSIRDAEEYLAKSNAQANISACCKGKKHRAYGYVWRYSDDPNYLEVKPLTPYRSSINQFTKSGDYIHTYSTIREASRITGIHESSISNCIKGRSKSAGGYVWKFANI